MKRFYPDVQGPGSIIPVDNRISTVSPGLGNPDGQGLILTDPTSEDLTSLPSTCSTDVPDPSPDVVVVRMST